MAKDENATPLAPGPREKHKLQNEKTWDTLVPSRPISSVFFKVIYQMWSSASEY